MKLNRDTSKLFIFAIVVLLLLNFHCWRPGIGGRTKLKSGERPAGAELELYYGYPACYQAELWRSDNTDDIQKLLANAPFIRPHSGMTKEYGSFGVKPTLVNLGFAASVLALIILASHIFDHDNYNLWTISTFVGLALFAIALHEIGDRTSVGL